MGKFLFVEAFREDLNKNSNYRGFRITEVQISEVLLYYVNELGPKICIRVIENSELYEF